MHSVRRAVRTVPFPFLGYVLGVVGFLFLGVFVAALAGDLSFAPLIGFASAGFFIAMVACFRVRAYQIAHPEHGDVGLSMDPMRPAEDPRARARYLMNYRGTDRRSAWTPESEQAPKV